MVLIGYEVYTKGYKCYDRKQCSIDINKDIIFEEKRHWNWRNFKAEKKEGILYVPRFFNIDNEEIYQVAPLMIS